jgi:ferredoxin--NADP+ reductase
MSQADKYTAEKITELKGWTPHLFSFKLTRFSGYRFVPGQFARLGIKKEDGEIVWRAYSIVSASYDEHLEFFSIVVPDGEFTTRLAKLEVGDEVLVEKMNYGFLTTSRFEQGKDLWMLSTGTGVAPFISILQELETWEDYENIVLVYSVREEKELAYVDTIEGLKTHEYFGEFSHKLKFVPVVTRETIAGALSERIPTLLESGELEGEVGIKLDSERSRIMICGNPEMVEDTRNWFTERGYTVSRRSKP